MAAHKLAQCNGLVCTCTYAWLDVCRYVARRDSRERYVIDVTTNGIYHVGVRMLAAMRWLAGGAGSGTVHAMHRRTTDTA